jgi:Mn2+/Fe2+ NRAMP family transporter
MLTAGAVLFTKGIMINSAAQAALALKPLAGNLSFLVFSIAIIVSGLLAVPVLAMSTAIVVSDNFNWPDELNLGFKEEKAFYSIMLFTLGLSALIALINPNPIRFLFFSQVLDGLLVPYLVFLILRLTNSKKVMGKHQNSTYTNVVGWITILVMSVLDIMLIWQFIGL